jgi:hypothetical protein
MFRTASVGLAVFCSLGFALGCGGAAQPAATPAAAVTPSSEKATPATSTTAEPKADANKTASASTTAEPASGEKPTRPPHEILQLKDTIFKLNFDESDRGKTASGACDQKAGDQPRKRSACMSAARDALDVADGYQVQHVGDDWVWKAVRLRGNHLTTISKTPFEFGTETENSIVIKFLGKPAKNMTAEVKIEVPSDYRIVLPDSRYGQVVYEAKVGIASGGE